MGLRPWQVKVEGPTQEAQPLCRPQTTWVETWHSGVWNQLVFQGLLRLPMVLGLIPSPPLGSWICWFFTLSRALSHHLGLSCNLLAPSTPALASKWYQVTSSMNHNPGVREGWLTLPRLHFWATCLPEGPWSWTERVTPLSAWTLSWASPEWLPQTIRSYVGVQMGCDQQLWVVPLGLSQQAGWQSPPFPSRSQLAIYPLVLGTRRWD